MESLCANILDKWAEYIDYDKNKKQFNLLSWDYSAHKKTDKIQSIIDNYDESGFIAVLTVKALFNAMLKDSRVKLYDVLTKESEFNKHKEMYQLFYSEEFIKAEKAYFNNIKKLALKLIGKEVIGDFDDDSFEEKIFELTDVVVSTLDKCRTEFYQKGGKLKEVTNFSTSIHVFPTLAECLLSLQKGSDGIYLCYIDAGHTADGYFGYFVRNNGNIFSFNERIDEAFKGQHTNARNGRWAEGKNDDIFPYDFIFSYENYDYKGYSHTYNIDENKLNLINMEEDAYLPLLVAMIFLAKKITNINPDDYETIYLDSLLHVNLSNLSSEKNEIIALNQNELVISNNKIDLDFSHESIMSGEALHEFDGLLYGHNIICSQNAGQIFVDLYGDGFQYNPNLVFSTQRMLSTGKYEYVPEFVGSKERMRAQAYCEIRQQLADYIKVKMHEEFDNFGGSEAVEKWFSQAILNHLDTIKKLAVNYYVALAEGKASNLNGHQTPLECDDKYHISYIQGKSVPYTYTYHYQGMHYVNDWDKASDKVYDMDNGAVCSMFFVFRPLDYTGLEALLGEVPKIIKGWTKDGRRASGNSLLDMTDAVEEINTPFEYYTSVEEYDGKTARGFNFAIGFSKRGFKATCKKYGVDINKYKDIEIESSEE